MISDFYNSKNGNDKAIDFNVIIKIMNDLEVITVDECWLLFHM